MARISLKVNGKTQVVDVDPETPLLYVLRNDLQLNGPINSAAAWRSAALAP
jgi:nicotinate dehydrogenase subunit A